jgi:hypothetical protein
VILDRLSPLGLLALSQGIRRLRQTRGRMGHEPLEKARNGAERRVEIERLAEPRT